MIKRHNCSVDGCGQYVFSKKLCIAHFKAQNPEKFKIKASTKPIERKPLKPSSKPLKKVSKKLEEQLKEYRLLRDEYMAKVGKCERCTSKENLELHHKKGRGKFLLEHFCVLCSNCHSYCHLHPIEATEQGFIISKLKQ